MINIVVHVMKRLCWDAVRRKNMDIYMLSPSYFFNPTLQQPLHRGNVNLCTRRDSILEDWRSRVQVEH